MLPTLPIEALVAGAMVFARLTGMLMVMPGFSGLPRIARMMAAVPLTLVMYPSVAGLALPADLPLLIWGMVVETALGLAMGALVAFFLATMSVAGDAISANIGLNLAQQLDPLTGSNGNTIGTLANFFGVGLFIVSDTHLRCIEVLGASFQSLPPGTFLAPSVAAPVLADAAGTALRTGAELAGPVVLFSFLIHLAISVLGRMAPNLNLFFSVGISANMTGGLAVLMLAFPTMLLAFLPQLDTMVLRLAQLVGVGG